MEIRLSKTALTGMATGHGRKSEGTSSSEQYEHNVGSLALNVMVQDQSVA